MRNSKIMLVTIATLVATWFCFGLIGAFASGESIRFCMTHYVMIYPMIIVGWIPASIVSVDYTDRLDK